MKIIHVVTEFGLGGADVVATNLALKQVKNHATTVIGLRCKNLDQPKAAHAQRENLKRHNVQVLEIGGANFRLNLPFLPFKLAKIFKEIKPDIVHSHTDLPDICVSIANRMEKVKIARTIHNTKIWDTWWWPGYISESGFQDDLIIPISQATVKTYEELRERYNLKKSPFQKMVRNGVTQFKKEDWLKKEEFARKFGADLANFQVGFFGRITEQKGVDVLIEAISKISASGIEFHIFGDGEDREHLSGRALELGLPVKFHGQVENAPILMSAFDLIVMPSRYEGFGLVSVEAQAAGTPVLITNAPGLHETVAPEWPLMVPPDDAAALASMLKQTVEGIYDLTKLRAKAKEWAANFDFENTALQYEDAYNDYLRLA